LSKDDLNTLTQAIEISPNYFGESNSRLCINLANQAKNKKKEYENYVNAKENLAQTNEKLATETDLRMSAEAREGVLIIENQELKVLIEELQGQIAKFEQQSKRLSRANKKLKDENLASKELLQSSGDLVAQMLMLMPRNSIDNATMDSLPTTLVDSLVDAQCGISQLLKSNFVITIEQLKANQPFMDSAVVFFKENKKHSAEITNYIDNGNELINRLRNSQIDCAISYAADIESEMNGFLTEIENKEIGTGFADFILNNIAWLAPVFLVILFGIIWLIRKTSKKQKS
jgi:hypothetical protein